MGKTVPASAADAPHGAGWFPVSAAAIPHSAGVVPVIAGTIPAMTGSFPAMSGTVAPAAGFTPAGAGMSAALSGMIPVAGGVVAQVAAGELLEEFSKAETEGLRGQRVPFPSESGQLSLRRCVRQGVLLDATVPEHGSGCPGCARGGQEQKEPGPACNGEARGLQRKQVGTRHAGRASQCDAAAARLFS